MKNKTLMLLISIVAFNSCSSDSNKPLVKQEEKKSEQKIMRYASITGLKPDKEAYYRELHAHAWPAVLNKITECNIRNYSIYEKQIEGKIYLFSYFEYIGNDFDNDMKKMAADTTTQRWWKETAPTQIPLPEAAAKNETWTKMEEVFHTN